MKKIILMAAVAMVSLAANAQVWMGGSLGFETKHVNGYDKNTNSFTITPEVGYSLDEDFDIALALGYEHNDGKTNTWSVNPYVRYKFVKAGNFTAFLDGGVKYATEHTNGVDNNANFVGVNVAPGISYAVSPKVTLVAHLGDGLQYGHTWVKDAYRENKFAFELFNGVSFGAYYNF